MKKLQIFTALFIAFISFGCGKTSSNPQAEQAATEAALAWVELIDSGNYVESWEQSAAPFKNSTTAEKWGNMVTPVRDPLGKVEARKLADREYLTSLPNTPKGDYVIVQFKTDLRTRKA